MAFKVVVSQKEVTHQIEVEDGKALNEIGRASCRERV